VHPLYQIVVMPDLHIPLWEYDDNNMWEYDDNNNKGVMKHGEGRGGEGGREMEIVRSI
jgi:hypothetical protein